MTSMTAAIGQKDLIPFATYKKGRDEYIRKMIAYKNDRRVRIDPNVSLLFENRQTVLFQIQELVFSEDLTDAAEIAEYIDIYAALLPRSGELSATLFIEIDNQPVLENFLVKLKGIEHALFLYVNDEPVRAVFEEEHEEREFTTSVHYLKFPLSGAARTYLTTTASDVAKCRIVLDHAAMHVDVALGSATIKSLQADLNT